MSRAARRRAWLASWLSLTIGACTCEGGAPQPATGKPKEPPRGTEDPALQAQGERMWGGLRVRVVGDRSRSSAPVVVLLHGLGADGDDLVPMARTLLESTEVTRIVLPEAPLKRQAGGRAWWRLSLSLRPDELMKSTRDLSGTLDFVPEGLTEARRNVLELLAEVSERLGASPNAIVLGGYSQGAILAMDVALHAEPTPAAVVAMSGTFLAREQWHQQLSDKRDMPVFLSHGRQDRLLPYAKAVKLRDFLRDSGLDVTWVPYDGGHSSPPRVTRELGRFLDQAL